VLVRHPGRRLGAPIAIAASLALLTGCNLPDVSLSPGMSHGAGTTSKAPAAASKTPAPAPVVATPTRQSGDLDTGTVTHKLPAGARTVVIDYWTAQDAKLWKPGGTKTIQVAAHVEGGGTLATVKVTRFLATADDGTTRTEAGKDDGEFVVTPPFSYSSVISLLPSSPKATAVTLYTQFDLLVETGYDTGLFFRQTVLDSLKLPFVQEVNQ
jgi:hypothetical protein